MRYFFFSLLFLCSCTEKQYHASTKIKNDKVLHVNYTVQTPKDSKIKLRKECQIDVLETFFQLQADSSDYKFLINYQESDFTYPLGDLYQMNNHSLFKPTLLSLTDISDSLTIAKIGYFSPHKKGFSSVSIIYNLMLIEDNGNFTLTNMLNHNTQDWQIKTVGEITYHAKPAHKFNLLRMEKMVDFNQQMAKFFHGNPMSIDYYISPTIKHSMEIRGYDFQYSMYLSDQIGAITYPNDKIIFVGNNSEYYPHEVVHLYLHAYFPYTHDIIGEGLATYFGGSKGLPFEEHIKALKVHLSKNKIDILDKLYCQPGYTINEKTSLWYSMGAFLCDLTLKQCGKQGLIKLLDSGKENEELSFALEELFGLEIENFNQFIRKKLKNYHAPAKQI